MNECVRRVRIFASKNVIRSTGNNDFTVGCRMSNVPEYVLHLCQSGRAKVCTFEQTGPGHSGKIREIPEAILRHARTAGPIRAEIRGSIAKL